MTLQIDILEHSETSLKLALAGSLDSETAPQLEQSLIETVGPDTHLVAFDLQHLNYISSAGLRVFFATVKKLKSRGGRVAVSHMQPGVKKVFEIVKALPDLSVFASMEELDEYLAGFQTSR
ncbi:STAS domain-containing protein [Gilvimarinus sp. DA14]|uniref:STAS domain-containing protein n=1 Tax=Gilvimarinus sp. DA14 TaxID=2956798 RepID=UPI0020B75D1A|nr:STAS domain-containing protein [Gilvimarinus sp. DA14]UTF60296.1 STAS domain-containing protein [Gilvimarinus sp. DA14]